MIIDTHAHLNFQDYAEDLEGVIQRANEAGVERIIAIGTDVEGSRECVALAERFPEVYAAVGIHPNNAIEAASDAVSALRELARHAKVVAIGESGLDYYRMPGGAGAQKGELILEAQQEAEREKAVQAVFFQQQLELAVELGLNMVVHQRGDCWADTLRILEPFNGRLKTVFHCFGGTLKQAQELINLGHLVSFTGIVTFKNAAVVQQTAAALPLDSFMLETDCPYLAPVPHRGKRCEPAFTRNIAQKIAELRGESLETVACSTTSASERFFCFLK
jgi:TatD DNase family protein